MATSAAAVVIAIALAVGRVRAFVRDAPGFSAVLVAVALAAERIGADVRDAPRAAGAVIVAVALAATGIGRRGRPEDKQGCHN